MAQKIDIGIDARLNTQQAEAGVLKLDRALGNLGRKRAPIISDDELKRANEAYQVFLKINREFERRVKATGQSGRSLGELDFDKLSSNPRQRAIMRQQVMDYVGLGGGGQGGGGGGGGYSGGVASQAMHAGLNAAGPVGRAASTGISSGMKMGIGAGLGGFFGSLLADGVGSLVSSISERIEKAENNNIAFDKLKRTLGDVGVGFTSLKANLMQTSDGLRMTYDETTQLAERYTKSGNLSGEQYKQIPEELGLGVGLSRAYGLDPSKGVDVLGQMRGVGVTRNTQETRSMALLIGETIAKSDAFAKADEVMDSIAAFATAQTRQSLTAANVGAYGGMFSSMVGSGIAGLDVANSANILNRMNASLAGGGAKGEASQFFTAMVGNRMGLDPFQTQILREGGMFSTNKSAFGDGSAYARYMGKAGPQGDTNFYEATRSLLEEKYAGNTDQQKLFRANAFANHTGLNMSQAMAMLSLQPNQMGQLQKYAGDMSTLSASGINNMALSLFGNSKQRNGVRDSLLSRSDLKKEDRDALNSAFGAGGTEDQQKEVLARLSAQYEQEKTMGTDIRDSRALLENIKTNLADKLVPAMDAVRSAAIYMAGGKNGTTLAQMEAQLAKNEAKGKYDSDMASISRERETLTARDRERAKEVKQGKLSHDENVEARRAIAAERDALDQRAMNAKKTLDASISDADRPKSSGGASGSWGAPSTGGASGSWDAPSAGGSQTGKSSSGGAAGNQAAMKFFMDKGWSKEQAAGIVSNLHHESKLNPSVVGDGGRAYGIAQWHPDRQANFERWAGKSIRGSTVEEQMGFVNYELTEGKEKAAGDRLRRAKTANDAGDVVSRYYERPLRTEHEASTRGATAERFSRIPIPDANSSQAPGNGNIGGMHITADPVNVNVTAAPGVKATADNYMKMTIGAPKANMTDW